MVNFKIQTFFKKHPLMIFFGLSYLIAWMIWLPTAILAPDLLLVMVLPGAWAPTLSAIVITGIIDGKTGMFALLKRGLKWRVGIQWYMIVFFVIAIIGVFAIITHSLLGGLAPSPSWSLDDFYISLPIIYLSSIFLGGPIAEEFGWRGFALPRLQTKMSAFYASLIIGVVWGAWHLPFFLFPEGSVVIGNLSFALYLPLLTGLSVLFSWIYNNTNGSVLMMILFHAAMNTTLGNLGIFESSSEDSSLLAINVALIWLVAGIIALIFGPAHLARKPRKRRALCD